MRRPNKMSIGAAVAIAVGVAVAMGWFKGDAPKASPSPSTSLKACTLEAKICPDGSAVGRVGPNCEFAPCPTPSSGY